MTVEKVARGGSVDQVNEELKALKARLAQLESSLGGAAPGAEPEESEPPAAQDLLLLEPEEFSEEILTWAGKAHLFTRLSTLCFLLVVALILRTITDNNIISHLTGSALGMGYAAGLMLWGAYQYERGGPLAPIFACCGACLMSVIVVETHARFASLPLVPAYLTLIATGGWMTFVSYRHRTFLPMSLGTLGMCLAGAAIDYPHPFFPYLALILFAANILGYFAAQLKRCSWLRWIVLVVTIAMLQLWGVKLGMVLMSHQPPPPELAPTWFLPALAAFALLYLGLACAGIMRSSGERISRFDFALPTVNVLWSFSAAYYVVEAQGGSLLLLALIGMALAAGHLGVTFWLTGRGIQGAPGTNSFALAGAALAALALPVAFGNYLVSLPALAIVSVFMATLSRKWQNGGIRVTSYLVHIYASLALALVTYFKGAAAGVTYLLPAALLSVIALYQYLWCRRYPPPSPSVFSRFDARDRSATLLLLAALLNGFCALRMVLLHAALLYTPAKEVANTVHCSETVLINAAAALLIVLAYYRSNKELRNVAILITVIGAAKVFLSDLLGGHGVPLVASVFSFGVAAALESLALGQWQKRKQTATAKEG